MRSSPPRDGAFEVPIAMIWAEAKILGGDWGAIGWKGKLPFDIPEDRIHFRELTWGQPVIMGRKTWESLPFGSLPERTNLVLSRTHHRSTSAEATATEITPAEATPTKTTSAETTPTKTTPADPTAPAAIWVTNPIEAVTAARRSIVTTKPRGLVNVSATIWSPKIWVIGGATIFQLFLPWAQECYVTKVMTEVSANRFAPKLGDNWAIEQLSDPIRSATGPFFHFELWRKLSRPRLDSNQRPTD